MIINKNQRVEIKGTGGGHWKEFIATEEFNTGDERWKLFDSIEKKHFEPLSERCEIRLLHSDGSKQPVKYKKDSQVWDVIKEQIAKSKIKRYSWDLILGESLTKTILRNKMKGFTPTETYQIIIEHPMVKKITDFFPEHKIRLEEKIFISVHARYGENNTALGLYNKEFRR